MDLRDLPFKKKYPPILYLTSQRDVNFFTHMLHCVDRKYPTIILKVLSIQVTYKKNVNIESSVKD